ncbi:MAG: imidazolonepropionase [Bacteroidetes bacterium MedPE-SWsnd-G2]|nr:MAG: imidazolonepropionase [Bacteroidetes bacterium MedPE-SWsnd-G2]
MSILIINIKSLVQVRPEGVSKLSGEEMKTLPTIEDAFLLIEDDTIIDYGKMTEAYSMSADKIIDATGKLVLPSWCDSHTHIVYAGDRSQEFVDRINGLSYEEIANRGGGILNSAEKLQNCSENDLFEQSLERLINVTKLGTGAIEIKSGYGLTVEAELKMLRVIKKLKDETGMAIKSTLLGAHALPVDYKNNKSGYVDQVIEKMLTLAVKENLADYVDVFCEKGYFDLEDTEKIMAAAKAYGIKSKIHVNQFNAFGGVELGVKYDALSVDHLEEMNPEDYVALKGSNTIPVALPSCSYFLSIPYTPGRKIIDSGLPLALATDYNPGSTPSGNMNFVVSTACIKMKLTPEEAINAATLNGAYAMGLSDSHGSITIGKKANIIITKPVSNYNYLPYAFGDNLIDKVYLNGKIVA